MSRAEWVAAIDMGLWWVGAIAGVMAAVMVLAMGWNTYRKYATASGVRVGPAPPVAPTPTIVAEQRIITPQRKPVDRQPLDHAYRILKYWGASG